MITAGIDCGKKNAKTIILKDREIVGKGAVLAGFDTERMLQLIQDFHPSGEQEAVFGIYPVAEKMVDIIKDYLDKS